MTYDIQSYEELQEVNSDFAFCSYVDGNYFEGFLALLRSLIINNGYTDFDYVVLHDHTLSQYHVHRIKEIYPRVKAVKVDPGPYQEFVKGNKSNYLVEKAYYILEAFKLRGYRKVVCLDTDMVVLKSIRALFELPYEFAACSQYFDSDGGRKLNSGLLVLGEAVLTDSVCDRIMDVGRRGDYELEKHDQGILTTLFGDTYHRLDPIYNAVKRRFLNKPVTASVKILHFTGSIKPWEAAERGYTKIQSVWQRYNMGYSAFLRTAIASTSAAKNHAACVYYTRQFLSEYGYDRIVALKGFSAFRALTLTDEIGRWLRQDNGAEPKELARYCLYRGLCEETLGGTSYLWLSAALRLGEKAALPPIAQLLWREKKLKECRVAVNASTSLAPADRANLIMLRRLEQGEEISERWGKASDDSVGHAAFYMTKNGNAGDILLPLTVRKALETVSPIEWAPIHVHQTFDGQQVQELNRRRGLVIGGGGLFISDTARGSVSGWQWNIALEQMERLNVPVAVYAVGYNRFPGQPEFAPVFSKHVTKLVEKASFFGLRNQGSIDAVRSYLPEELRDKVTYQPCPTTVAHYLFPELFKDEVRKDYIALNIAYDRADLRFQDGYGEFLREMSALIRRLCSRIEVRYFAHTVVDEQFVFDLAREGGISLACDRLYELDEQGILRKYREPRIAIGMRGHAGMIPFGCGTPIISLITHEKLRYFLEDVDLKECGFYVNEPDLAERVAVLAERMLERNDEEVVRIQQRAARLWGITLENARRVVAAFSG